MLLLCTYVYTCHSNTVAVIIMFLYALTAQQFYRLYSEKQEMFHEEELLRLKSITTPQQMLRHELFEAFR